MNIFECLDDVNQLKKAIAAGADVNAKDEDGWTVLHYAAAGGKLEVVKYLVEKHHLDVNAKGKYEMTVLHHAAAGGHLEVVKYLVEQGADVNAKDDGVGTVLHYAAAGGKLEVVKYLVEKSHLDVNAKDEAGETALHSAVGGIQNKVLESEMDGDTALHSAVEGGYLEVVKYLVEQGADVNAVMRYEGTALDMAKNEGYTEIAKVLEDELRKLDEELRKREAKKRRGLILFGTICFVLCVGTISLLINLWDVGYYRDLFDAVSKGLEDSYKFGNGLLSGCVLLYLFYLLLINADGENLEHRKVEKIGNLLLFFIPAFLMFLDIDSIEMKWFDKSDLILWYMGICFGEIALVNAPQKFSSTFVGQITTYIKSRFYIVGVIFVVAVFNFLHWEHSWLMHILSFVSGLVVLIVFGILSVILLILLLIWELIGKMF